MSVRLWAAFILAFLLVAASGTADAASYRDTPGTGGGQSKSIAEASVSSIEATVLSVRKFQSPRVRLELRVTSSSNPTVLDLRDSTRVITAENYLGPGKGQDGDPQAAYYLLPGDEIRAKLFAGAVAGNRDVDWYVSQVSRTGGRGSNVMPTKIVSAQGDLQLVLEVPRSTYFQGESVQMTFTVTNSSRTETSITFPTGQRYDFSITQGGREVWRWSRGRAFTMLFGTMKLKPGERLTYKATWPQTVDGNAKPKPGDYAITATLAAQGVRPTVGPLTIRIQTANRR